MLENYELVVTQGFDHVAASIFQDLNDQDICHAKLVCKQWYLYIIKQKFYWRRILIKAQKRSNISNPEWKSLIESILELNDFQDLYTMGSIMQDFYATSIPRKCENILTPYYVAAWNGNLDHLEFLWPHFKVRKVSDLYKDLRSRKQVRWCGMLKNPIISILFLGQESPIRI